MAHDWPGNVRELRNAAERFTLGLAGDGIVASGEGPPLTLVQQMDQVEKALIEQALRQHRGHATQTSDALGIGKKTLYDKLARHGIAIDGFRAASAAPGTAAD
jgi:two-component system C4-dicarboxylate transport response regulator DctD